MIVIVNVLKTFMSDKSQSHKRALTLKHSLLMPHFIITKCFNCRSIVHVRSFLCFLANLNSAASRSVQEKWMECQQARVMLDSAAGDVPNDIEHEGAGYSPNRPIFAKMVSLPVPSSDFWNCRCNMVIRGKMSKLFKII